MPMLGRGRLITVAAGMAVVALIAWILMPQPVAVETATVTRGAFEKTVDEDGRTRVRDRYVASAPLAGRLLRVDIKAGDAVARGQALATLLPAAPALLDARIVAEQRSDAVLVPLGAVFRERDAWAAYALEGGRARLRAVELGPRSATHAVVQAGLDPGEVVIVYPGDAVADGVRVAARAR